MTKYRIVLEIDGQAPYAVEDEIRTLRAAERLLTQVLDEIGHLGEVYIEQYKQLRGRSYEDY